MSKMHLPRIMLAATASGSGKTTITCGLLQAFVNRRLSPVSFKCGPDYIDPMFHTKVIKAESRNLDTFFTDERTTRYLFARYASSAGISVLEGAMGIYDGLGGVSARASSYELASVTDTPVILIVNARGMSLSVIPLIQGYLDYQKRLGRPVIGGVILNQTTETTYLMLKDRIQEQTGIRTYGYVPQLSDCTVESRHLGLVTPDEITGLQETVMRLSDELEQCLDIDGIITLASEASDYEENEKQSPKKFQKEKAKIAVALDEAFCFYYADNLGLLSEMGAEIITFSPLRDRALPEEIQGLILGGGYPELHAARLAANTSMKESIAGAIGGGLPYLAECGGFMYLHEEMEDMQGRSYPMCGVIPGRSFRTEKLSRFGYVTLSADGKSDGAAPISPDRRFAGRQLLPPGQTIRGHEFHYFDSADPGSSYRAKKPAGRREWDCIHGGRTFAAGYPHLYYWSNPQFAANFLHAAACYQTQIHHKSAPPSYDKI